MTVKKSSGRMEIEDLSWLWVRCFPFVERGAMIGCIFGVRWRGALDTPAARNVPKYLAHLVESLEDY